MPLTKYIWDVESDNVLTETDENDVTTVVYTNEPGEFGSLISQRRGNVTSTYHYDGLGSTRELTDSTETVTDTYTYTAFGENVATTGTTTNPFRYVGSLGYYFDSELADYYVRARTYQPTIARWSTRDPIWPEGGINPYEYGSNDPVNRIDPFGTVDFYCTRPNWDEIKRYFRCLDNCTNKCFHSPPCGQCALCLVLQRQVGA